MRSSTFSLSHLVNVIGLPSFATAGVPFFCFLFLPPVLAFTPDAETGVPGFGVLPDSGTAGVAEARRLVVSGT